MGLTLTASYSHAGYSPPREPPLKKLRVSDSLNYSNILSQQESRSDGAPSTSLPTPRIETPVPIPRPPYDLPGRLSTPAYGHQTPQRQQQPSLQYSASPIVRPPSLFPGAGSEAVRAPAPAPAPAPALARRTYQNQPPPQRLPSQQYSQTPVPIPRSGYNSPLPLPLYGRLPVSDHQVAGGPAPPNINTESPVPIARLNPLRHKGTSNNAYNQLSSPAQTEQRTVSNSPIPLPATVGTLPSQTVLSQRVSSQPVASLIAASQTLALERFPSDHLTSGRSLPATSGQALLLTTTSNSPPRKAALPPASQPLPARTNHHDSPSTPKKKKKQFNATSPENFRVRAHALSRRLRQDAPDSASVRYRPGWQSLTSRPYKPAAVQTEILSGSRKLMRLQPGDFEAPEVFHVDFSVSEIQEVWKLVRVKMGLPLPQIVKNVRKELKDLVLGSQEQVYRAVSRLPRTLPTLPGRTALDIRYFVHDLAAAKTGPKGAREPRLLTLERDDLDKQGTFERSARVSSLLFAREVGGQRGYGSMRRLENFTNEFRKCREDDLELRAQWSGCAGDIATVTWLSNDGFICGTTEHSDAHNQQYNKIGNLVLGSCSRGTLKAYPDHRILRPVVEVGENSTDAMRQSQSPWLYTSVVYSDYDERYDRAYTCGFDRTVKVWRADKTGATMSELGTWHHNGNVNFVVASRHQSGMVATAADVAAEAVRVYYVNENDIAGSSFRSFSCSRVVDIEGNTVSTDKWAYFPATVQWGQAPTVQHLVAVGYSPRSRTADDGDIPEDRRATGEICVWDGLTGERWTIISGSKLNVFEILWHPSQAVFIAATSPQAGHGVDFDSRVRTQIRVFYPAGPEYGDKAFAVHQTLDCTAVDINELTIMPNSIAYCYVTAGCTDGKTYVWDTAQGDKPIHVLKHGTVIEENYNDTGVKFCAWGTTPDRFYTGSSDGVVKVWNIRTKGKPRCRDILEVDGPVSFGKFSPDMSRLIVGDATGKVSFLSVNKEEDMPVQHINLPPAFGFRPLNLKVIRPRLMIPHKEPEVDTLMGNKRGRGYLQRQELILTNDRLIGAIQGPNYVQTGLFRREFHADDDPSKPLLSSVERHQQHSQWQERFIRRQHEFRPLKPDPKLTERHFDNSWLPLDSLQLSEEDKKDIIQAGKLVESDFDGPFDIGNSSEDFEDDSDDIQEREMDHDAKGRHEEPPAVEENEPVGKDGLIEQDEEDAEDGDSDIQELSAHEWLSAQQLRRPKH